MKSPTKNEQELMVKINELEQDLRDICETKNVLMSSQNDVLGKAFDVDNFQADWKMHKEDFVNLQRRIKRLEDRFLTLKELLEKIVRRNPN